MVDELDLLGRIALVAGLVPRQDLLDDVDLLVLGADDLLEQAQRPGDRVRRVHVALERDQHRAPLLHERVEHPFLLLLVLDGLVVHHPEALHEREQRVGRAVVAQRLQGLEAIGRLRILVDRRLRVALPRPFGAAVLREQIEYAHGSYRAGVYTREGGSSTPKAAGRATSVSGRVRARCVAACLWAWACFSPRQPTCAFSCAADGLCPAGYSCSATDGWCHRDDAPDATCEPSQLDAGSGLDGAGGDATGADAAGD